MKKYTIQSFYNSVMMDYNEHALSRGCIGVIKRHVPSSICDFRGKLAEMIRKELGSLGISVDIDHKYLVLRRIHASREATHAEEARRLGLLS